MSISVADHLLPPPYGYTPEAARGYAILEDSASGTFLDSAEDLRDFERLCQLVGEYSAAREAIRRAGSQVFVTRQGNVRPRPEVAVAAQAEEQFIPLLDRFGLTPAGRARQQRRMAHRRPPCRDMGIAATALSGLSG